MAPVQAFFAWLSADLAHCRNRHWLGALLLSIFVVQPPQAAAQPRCASPVAAIVSAEGDVAVVAAVGVVQVRAAPEFPICPGESVRIGRLSRAAVVLAGTGQIIRLDENSVMRIVAPREGPQLDVLRGVLRLFSPAGRPLDIRTPYVSAGVEGTEFFVAVDAAETTARVGVIDGRVSVANARGSLLLGAGEVAAVRGDEPPRRIDIRPRDQVRWAIFYPPALWSLPRGTGAPLDARVAEAWRLWRLGDAPAARRAIEAVSIAEVRDADSLAYLAALLLSVGRLDVAGPALARADALDPTSAAVPALRAIVALALNDTAEALRLADLAVARARDNPGARIAQSYALQSARRLDAARDALEPAVRLGDALALARLAEIELARGRAGAARWAAKRAIAAAPSLSRPHSILGFSALAQFDFGAARDAFAAAAALDPGDPLPRLGRGLATIRDGDLEGGRRELEIAVALDPESAVARSYLGKAYAGERHFDAARREWALAREVDPQDPTPWLYEAIAARSLNRPVEALRNMERSIALNEGRAVYRSSLLLDQDLATRTTGLASVYRDLGFDQLALFEGTKSVNIDPANPGAHRFLADTYLALPRHETASDSELLQSLLLQPLNVTPLRPRLSREGLGIIDPRGPLRLGYNEFSPLFSSNGVDLLVDGFAGNHNIEGGNVIASGLYRNFSASAGQFYYRTSGIRENNDLRRRISDILVQPALSDRASLLAQFRYSDVDEGDLALRFDPQNFDPSARERADRRQYRLGGRFDIAPSATLVGVFTHENLHDVFTNGGGVVAHDRVDGDFGESAMYLTGAHFNAVAGGGYFLGHDKSSFSIGPFDFPETESTSRHRNLWVYTNWTPLSQVRLTVGASHDAFRSDIVDRNQLNPKLGLAWNILPKTTLRAAWFSTLKRTTVGGQTIEPTQVAGFNQLYDDSNATKAERWGIGLDHKLSSDLFVGIEWSERRLDVPTIFVGPPTSVSDIPFKERFGRGYVAWLPTDDLAVTTEIQWERLIRDQDANNVGAFSDLSVLRLPVQLRWFNSSGFFGLLRTSFVHEDGRFQRADGSISPDSDDFITVDAGAGWRWPGRSAIAGIEVRNLFDSGFRFQDTDPINPSIVPARTVVGRVTLSF